MLTMIARLLKVLNSETEPEQISLALCFAMIAGLTPLFSLHNLFILLIVLIIRLNISSFILGLLFFSGIAYLLDPLFHLIGFKALTAEPIETLWTSLYNITLFRLANINNSVVIGSLLFSLILFIPVFILSKLAIIKYRANVLEWVQKTRIMQILKANKLYTAYKAVSG
jgi:uncharacterized protein (TIGR03546 family)